MGTQHEACFDMNSSTYGYSFNSGVPTATCTFGKTVKIKTIKIMSSVDGGTGSGLSMNYGYIDVNGNHIQVDAATLGVNQNKT